MYRADGDLVLGPGKPFALLAYLATLPDRRAGREHLLSLLWADQEPVAARHSLRQTIWYLRQRLGTEMISAVQDDVALTLPLQSDRTTFLAAIDAGRLDEAVQVYRGDFLTDLAVAGGIAFEHWADAERQHLRLLFQRAAESLARDELKRGQFRRARDLARRVRDADPLDERGWRLLIDICLTHGDQVTALTEVARLVQTLEAENRILEPATVALLRRVQQEPETSHDADAERLVAELVGREREFASLLSTFERARQNSPQVRALVSPAGIGKTRLLRDLGRRLAAAGATVVYIRAHPGDRDIPWLYVCDLVHRLADQPGGAGVSPASAAILVDMEPSLSSRFQVTPESSIGEEQSRRRVAAMVDLIQSVSHEHPVALLLDDLHWADATSREAIEQAGRRLTRERLLLVQASRPGQPVRTVDHETTIHLSPLTVEQVEALLASIGQLPAEPWVARFGIRLHAATEGSPLLVLETLQLAIETGCLELVSGQWSCLKASELTDLLEAGSATLRRIRQLDRDKFWHLLLLSLAGTPLRTRTMVGATNCGEEHVTAILHHLERRGFVARAGDQWAIAHDEIGARVENDAEDRQRVAAHAISPLRGWTENSPLLLLAGLTTCVPRATHAQRVRWWLTCWALRSGGQGSTMSQAHSPGMSDSDTIGRLQQRRLSRCCSQRWPPLCHALQTGRGCLWGSGMLSRTGVGVCTLAKSHRGILKRAIWMSLRLSALVM